MIQLTYAPFIIIAICMNMSICNILSAQTNKSIHILDLCRTTNKKLTTTLTSTERRLMLDKESLMVLKATFQRTTNIWTVACFGDFGFDNPNNVDTIPLVFNQPVFYGEELQTQIKIFPPIRSMVMREKQWWSLTGSLKSVEYIQLCAGRQNEMETLLFLAKSTQLRGLSVVVHDSKSIEPISVMTSLENLKVDGFYSRQTTPNAFSDASVIQLATLKNLRKLDLSETKITRKSLGVLKQFPRLECLILPPGMGRTNVTDTYKIDLSQLLNLKTLELGILPDEGYIAQTVLLPPKLKEITLRTLGSNIQNVQEWVKQIPTINIEIDFGNDFEIYNFQNLKSISNISTISISSARDLSLAMTILDGIYMRAFKCFGCCFGYSDGIRKLSKLTHLETLSFVPGYFVIGDEDTRSEYCTDISLLQSLVNLRHLELGKLNKLNENRLAFLRNLKQLRSLQLTLSTDNFDGSSENLFDVLQELDQLEDLSIGSAIVSNTGLHKLCKCKKLRRLNLMGSKGYTDEGLAKLMDESPSLQTVIRSYWPEKKDE